MYTCPKCKRSNLLADECAFTPLHKVRSCKICYNLYKRPINKRNYIDGIASKTWHKFYHLLKTYGLTKEKFEEKLKLQLNGCAICKEEFNSIKRINVDHNHKTKEIRDLLCSRCNTLVGYVEQNECLIFSVVEYIKNHTKVKVA